MALFTRRADRLQRELDARRSESQRVAQEIRNQLLTSPICSDYENLFAQVRPLINDMKMVRPYGVGTNGARLRPSRTPELKLLDSPNEDMGWAEFADLMFATWLTKDQLYIRTWRNNRGKIVGYTVLPSATHSWLGNEDRWTVQGTNGGTISLTKADVMTIRFSRNPDNPWQGVSPASATRIWAQADDLVGQYQRAFFENGALPATITFITASTQNKYDQVRKELETKTKGATNSNKTVYVWRQMLPETGQTADQIEVKTIQAPNSTLAIKDIVAIINDKLNKSVGVSNFILGDDSSAKYDNAELSDQQFVKRRVYPALVSFWSQFQHELDRITGGLGYAIQFDLEIPELTDRARTKSETAAKNAETLIRLVQAGADASSAAKALGLGEAWRRVAIGIQTQTTEQRANSIFLNKATEAEIKTEELPEPTEPEQPSEPHQDRCQHCHHVADSHTEFSKDEKIEKQIYDRLISLANAIIEENPDFDIDQVQDEIFDLLEISANNGGTISLERIAEIVDNPETLKLIKKQIEEGHQISDALSDRIRERTSLIVKDYDKTTREIMKSILNNAEELSAEKLKERMVEAIPDGKAATIARNETVYAFKSGRLDSIVQAEEYHHIKVALEWKCQPDSQTCDICAAMDGQKIRAGQAFAEMITVPAGTTLANGHTIDEQSTFAYAQDHWNDHGAIPTAHVNCRCYYHESLIRD